MSMLTDHILLYHNICIPRGFIARLKTNPNRLEKAL